MGSSPCYLHIIFDGNRYTLECTKNDKLIDICKGFSKDEIKTDFNWF